MPRDTSIHARCTAEEHARWHELSKQLGYDDFSVFLRSLLDSFSGEYDDYECRLLQVSEAQILGSGPRGTARLTGAASAFPVVAHARFWDHVDRHTSAKDS